MYRLFVAIDLPEDVKEAVAGICRGVEGARWVVKEQIHLTLRFIGAADEGLFGRIREALGGIAAGSFDLHLQGLGYFPPKKNPRVLWVGLSESEPLKGLAVKIESVLREVGVEPEERGFSPHITLARLREGRLSAITGFLAANGSFRTKPFSVEEFHLYSSTLTPKGAIHHREATYPLTGKA